MFKKIDEKQIALIILSFVGGMMLPNLKTFSMFVALMLLVYAILYIQRNL